MKGVKPVKVRYGVIGAGQAGARHAHALATNPLGILAWVADPARERATRLGRQLGTRAYADYREGLEEVEAVSICVPHTALAETALTALQARCHVLLEKPMATTLEDADRVIAAAGEARLVLMVGFVHRYRPEAQRARQLIAEGAIGAPVFLTDYGVGGGQERWPGWVQRADDGGGLLLYTMVHRIDRCRSLLDQEVVTVQASLGEYLPNSDVESSVAALLTFPGRVRAALTYHFHRVDLPFAWITDVHGTDGLIRILTGNGVEVTTADRTWHEDAGPERHFEAEIEAFLDAIGGKRDGIPTGDDGREALSVALAMARAHTTGAPVVLGPSTHARR